MATSQRTFDQVKNILGKLDRDIEAARAKRTQPPALPAPIQPVQNTTAPNTGVLAQPGTLGVPASPFGQGQAPRTSPAPHASGAGTNAPAFTAQGRPKAMKLDRSATASPN